MFRRFYTLDLEILNFRTSEKLLKSKWQNIKKEHLIILLLNLSLTSVMILKDGTWQSRNKRSLLQVWPRREQNSR